MANPIPEPCPVVLVALDGARAPLPAALEPGAVRARLRLGELDQINAATLAENRVLRAVLRRTKDGGGRLHLIGLVSDGGTHSSAEHLLALIDVARGAGVRVVVHVFLEGADAAVGARHIAELEAKLDGTVGRIGTVCGRTWGMAPEGRWDRTEKVYRALMADNVDRVDSALRGLEQGCLFGVPLEFVAPFVVFDYPGVSLVDSALHFNFAADGAGELTQALTATSFSRFARQGGRAPFGGRFACLTPYDDSLALPTLFPRAPDVSDISELLLECLAGAGRRALVCDAGPASELAKATLAGIGSGKYDLVVADLANPANVARGRFDAEGVVGRIAEAALARGGAVVVLGGRDALDSVPLAYLARSGRDARVRDAARVADLAPTLLELMRVARPREMLERSLLIG